MKNKFLYALLAVFLICKPFYVYAVAVQYQKYEKAEYGFSVKYPADWNVTEALNEGTGTFTFIPEDRTMQVDFIISDTGNEPVKLDKFVDDSIKVQLSMLTLPNGQPAMTIKKKSKAKLAKMPAKKVLTSTSITTEEGEMKLLSEQIYAIKGKKAYTAVLTTAEHNYKTNVKVFQKMLTSLKLKAK